jgi:hypothetical protein
MLRDVLWQRGNPLRGAAAGLLLGFGATLVLTQFGAVALSGGTLLIGIILGAMVGAARAWIGTPYRADGAPGSPSSPASDAPPPPPPSA